MNNFEDKKIAEVLKLRQFFSFCESGTIDIHCG